MRKFSNTVLAMSFAASSLLAADYPHAQISNGMVTAKLYLPDVKNGSYQGTRFDWAGIITSLQYKGHEYFGQWYEHHDPKIHDAITGPVEEFLSNDAGLGYTDAKPGGTFVRIGVGSVRMPDEKAFRRFETYEIVDPGKRSMRTRPDSIEFVHDLATTAEGYGYHYVKTVRLTKGKPELVLEHTLKNTGAKTIDTAVYDHNFFVIDNEVVGPDVVIGFGFDPKPTADLKGAAEIKGRELIYTKELVKGQSVFTEFEGFGESAKDYAFSIDNRKSGASVKITGDKPLSKVVFWSIRTTACPEPYVHMTIEPGKEFKWSYTYDLSVK